MCGRFTLRTPASVLAKAFGIDAPLQLALRFNIAPTQQVAVVRQVGASRELRMHRWGFFPTWQEQPERAQPLFNARDDGLTKKRSFFKLSFQTRRCLVPADGFYEWKKVDKKTKHPFYIRMRDDRLFAFAGLWTTWNEIDACTIVTTAANELTQQLHDRMPVILDTKDYDAWLDCETFDEEKLLSLLRPYDARKMRADRVGDRVNNWRCDEPSCIEPVSD